MIGYLEKIIDFFIEEFIDIPVFQLLCGLHNLYLDQIIQ